MGSQCLYLTGNTGKVTLTSGGNYQFSINYIQFGVPLCLVYQYGGEAIYDKTETFSFTFGGGLQPSVGFSAIGFMPKTRGCIAPVLKADIGFFAGIQWEVKVSYTYQSGNLATVRKGDTGAEVAPPGSVYAITSSTPLNIGVSFMPFSYGWDSSRW
jgi:hypothetical protein